MVVSGTGCEFVYCIVHSDNDISCSEVSVVYVLVSVLNFNTQATLSQFLK